MTWAEFKATIEAQGVTDDAQIVVLVDLGVCDQGHDQGVSPEELGVDVHDDGTIVLFPDFEEPEVTAYPPLTLVKDGRERGH